MKFQLPKLLKKSPGFTLIELLVVIAVLGVIAALVIAAVNPLEQLARGRDSGRKTTAAQLKNALGAYYTAQNATLPTADSTWLQTLVTAGELKSLPSTVAYSTGSFNTTACAIDATAVGAVVSNYCYAREAATDDDYVIYTRMESASEDKKCATASDNSYWLYSSVAAKAGIVCLSGDPTATQIGAGTFSPFAP